MGIVSLPVFFLGLLTGIAGLVLSLQLFTKYRVRYLSHLLFFMIAHFIVGFLNLGGRYLVDMCLGQQSGQSRSLGSHVMVLMALPFVVLALYFFQLFASEISEKRLSNFVSIWFIFIWLGIFVATIGGIKALIATGRDIFLGELYHYVNIGIMVLYILAILKMVADARWVNHPDKRRGLRLMGIFFLSLPGIYYGFSRIDFMNSFRSGGFLLFVFFFFCAMLPPVLYLTNLLKKLFFSNSLMPENALHLEKFFTVHNISTQEREVMKLVLQGKDNRFIARRLSISYGTVKNHLYNIYRRLDIKSRFELVQMVKQFFNSLK